MTVVCIDDGTDWIWAKSLHTNAIVIYISVPFVFIEHALKQCILSSRNESNGNIYLYFALSVFIRNRSSNICSKIILIHNRPISWMIISRFRVFVYNIDTMKTKCIFTLLFIWNQTLFVTIIFIFAEEMHYVFVFQHLCAIHMVPEQDNK